MQLRCGLRRSVANKFSPHLGTFRDPYFSTSWVSLLSLSGTFSVLFDSSSLINSLTMSALL